MGVSSGEPVGLGLDLGGSSIKYAVLVGDGAEVRIERTGLHEIVGARDAATVSRMLGEIASELATEFGGSVTLGIGLPGLFDAESGVPTLLPNFPPDWVGYPLRDQVQLATGMSVQLINDARAFALAEARLGAARGARNAICVVLGTGVGGGVILNGELWFGAGTGGEVGHQTVELDGPPCGCGNRGCVEAIAGSAALLAGAGRATVREVFEAARRGDAQAQAAITRSIRAVAAGLGNAYAVLAADVFVIGGGIADAGDQVLVPLREELRSRMHLAPAETVSLRPAELGRFAGAVGAALFGARGVALH
jgi:glucokinase